MQRFPWVDFRAELGKDHLHMTDTMTTTKQWVSLRWDCFAGFYYVGPFASADAAQAWAVEHEGLNIRWQSAHLDPHVALPVRPPGDVLLLQPSPTAPDHWTERPADVGDFFLLMILSDPLHLVGPFHDHRSAFSWAIANQERTDDEGWQVVWLDDPTTPARLLTPDDGVEQIALEDAEWRQRPRGNVRLTACPDY
jgi:hypothetical protein